jgi:hypothetical protein
VLAAHQLLDAGHVVGIHPAGDEGRHVQAGAAGIDLVGSQHGHYSSPEKNLIVSIRKARARLFDTQLTEINLG